MVWTRIRTRPLPVMDRGLRGSAPKCGLALDYQGEDPHFDYGTGQGKSPNRLTNCYGSSEAVPWARKKWGRLPLCLYVPMGGLHRLPESNRGLGPTEGRST